MTNALPPNHLRPVPTQFGCARRQRSQRGLALLMTILVLSSLLILGISLSTAVKADFEEAVFYRTYNEAHIRAQEGMAQAMGFLMYDVWGVNERDPFVCSQWAAGGSGDQALNKKLGDTLIADAGGINYAFQYNAAPLVASELELRRVEYGQVPLNRFGGLETVTLVADWDWVNTQIGGGTRVNQHELYGSPTAGRSRYTDAFLPTSSDVNDWFENGLHINRSDLHGYWRNNFPNRPTDLYAGGTHNGWGYTRSGAPVAEYQWHPGFGDYHGDMGFNFPFAEGKALDNDPVITAPWNFVNTNAMIGDSFTRVFRSDLVDGNYQNNTYDAMLMGPRISSADGKQYGGAFNINEVNNNYEIEQFPGVTTPNSMALASPDYVSNNSFDSGGGIELGEKFYYSGRSYHYNEAKWIYCYNDMGKPTGRYAVTILPDGGLPNVNSLGNPRSDQYFAWFPLNAAYAGLFPSFDRGYTIYGNMLSGRRSYGTAVNTAPDGAFAGNWDSSGSTYRAWSDETGQNRIKNGSLQGILKPGMTNLYSGAPGANYWQHHGQVGGATMRGYAGTSGSFSAGLSYTAFAVGTAHTNHPKFLTPNGAPYIPPAELYAGPKGNVGHLKYFGQGIISHVFWHLLAQGPIRTRAEFMMLLKKRAFMIDDENYNGMAASGLDENVRGNGTFYDAEDIAIAEQDCQFLAGWLTPISYHYTLDSLWNSDRVVLDSTADLYMGGVAVPAGPLDNCYFWSGIGSQSRNAGDIQSGYQGPCPTAGLDDNQITPGPWPALGAGDKDHVYKAMYRKVKGKTGAKALLQKLAQLRYLGKGLGVKKGGFTPYSPVSARSDAMGALIPGLDGGNSSRRRANAAGALSLSYLLSIIRIPNADHYDQWRTEQRFGETAGVVVNWKPAAGGGWDPDITIWPNMHWRQAWEVAAVSEWDTWTSIGQDKAPVYGAFALHQYMRSSVTEIGRARVYPPYYQNDLDLDGIINGANDFRKNLVINNGGRLFLPRYEESPYNQWMTHRPTYGWDSAGIGWRQALANYEFEICDGPPGNDTELAPIPIQQTVGTVDPVGTQWYPALIPATGQFGFTVSKLTGAAPLNDKDYRVQVRTKVPIPVKVNDQVTIIAAPGGATALAGGPFNGVHTVAEVCSPNSFVFYVAEADIGTFNVNVPAIPGVPFGFAVWGHQKYPPLLPGGPIPKTVVNLRMAEDPNTPISSGPLNNHRDYAYPEGIPLVMNFIELCWPVARPYASTTPENNENGESLCNKSWRKQYMPTSYFRMWVTDYNTPNNSGWTNLSDGGFPYPKRLPDATMNIFDSTKVRIHAGQGNSQPFLYVKGRLMQMTPGQYGEAVDNTTWYIDGDGKLGLNLLVNMFDQFDPVHWGVSVREADASGNLIWVNYNVDELHQRGVQRIFGKTVDMTWGIGNDKIPDAAQPYNPGNASIDNSFRWTTRAGNRGVFIRAHTPMFMQRGITIKTPNYDGASGNRAFTFENFLIDMPSSLAMRQQAEKRGTQQGGPDGGSGGAINLGAYLNSFCWSTFNRTYGQDCDWPAFHMWMMDGNDVSNGATSTAWSGGPQFNYSVDAPIIRRDGLWDRALDGHHDAYVNAGQGDANEGTHSPTAGNASMQAMTQGHPEQFKVIYFHPYFFPQKIVYGTRSRANQPVYNNVKYYDYIHNLYLTDHLANGEVTLDTLGNSPNVITNISRVVDPPPAGGDPLHPFLGARMKVTVTYSRDINGFLAAPSSTTGTPIYRGKRDGTTVPPNKFDVVRYIRVVGCADSSFNGVYPIEDGDNSSFVTFYQYGLPAAVVASSGGFANTPASAKPAGYCYQHHPFTRDYSGGHQLNLTGYTAGIGAWAPMYGAPVLPDTAWLRSSDSVGTTAFTPGSYFPPDNKHSSPGVFYGTNANAQSPVEFVERVHGIVTLPDYLGIGELPAGPGSNPVQPARPLWERGPWWVDGEEGGGAVEIDPINGFDVGDYVVATNGARGRVAAIAAGKGGATPRMIIEPCYPLTKPFQDDGSVGLMKLTIDPTRVPIEQLSGVLGTISVGNLASPKSKGQRIWYDYGRFNSSTISSLPTMDSGNVDPITPGGVHLVPPASSRNSYLRKVLEFSLSTPWVLDNNSSTMWQYNSAYCFKANGPGGLSTEPAIYGDGTPSAATRIDPAFGNVRWYLAKGTSHQCQVFSLPTPMDRNSNHVAWGASPFQRDRYGNGIEEDPKRPGTGPSNPGFNRHNGRSPGSPVSAYVKNKLELNLYQISNATFCNFKNIYYATPLGHASADEVDFHELCWWDMNYSTDLDSIWELGTYNCTENNVTYGGPGYHNLGKDPLSDPIGPGSWNIADPAKGYDMAQRYTSDTSFTDFIDNQNQGIREILTTQPLRPVDITTGRVEGHYNMDRVTTFVMNPNLIPSPMLYHWLSGASIGEAQPTYVFGNKPARGYVSASHMIGYCGTNYSSYHLTNWNSRIWYKHQSIGPSSFNDFFGVNLVTDGYGRMSNMVNFSPAPVYTALITGQSINDSGEAVAQIRLTVGVERTYDGKCNILEYQINTGLLGVK